MTMIRASSNLAGRQANSIEACSACWNIRREQSDGTHSDETLGWSTAEEHTTERNTAKQREANVSKHIESDHRRHTRYPASESSPSIANDTASTLAIVRRLSDNARQQWQKFWYWIRYLDSTYSQWIELYSLRIFRKKETFFLNELMSESTRSPKALRMSSLC